MSDRDILIALREVRATMGGSIGIHTAISIVARGSGDVFAGCFHAVEQYGGNRFLDDDKRVDLAIKVLEDRVFGHDHALGLCKRASCPLCARS